MPILTSQLPTLYKNDYCVLKGQFFRPNEAFPSNTMQTALIVKIIDPSNIKIFEGRKYVKCIPLETSNGCYYASVKDLTKLAKRQQNCLDEYFYNIGED